MCRKRSFLVGGKDQQKRNGKAERSGGLEIDHQLETRALLDRQIGGFFALQDFIGVNGRFHPDRRMAPAETRMPVLELGNKWPRDRGPMAFSSDAGPMATSTRAQPSDVSGISFDLGQRFRGSSAERVY